VDVIDLDIFGTKLEEFILVGPEFLYRVLNVDYLLWRSLILSNRSFYDQGAFIPYDADFWNSVHYIRKPENQYNIPGFEQHWSTLPPFEQPNIGWKMACLVPHTPQRLWDSFNRARKVGQGCEWLTIRPPSGHDIYRGHMYSQ
jgi:hypothetical protein